MAHLMKAHTFPGGKEDPSRQTGGTDHEKRPAVLHEDAVEVDESEKTSSTPSTQKEHGRTTTSTWKGVQAWWLEIFSCFASLSAIVAIVVTAHAYDNKPNPHWPRGLSINTLISTYVVVLKAALLTILTTGLNHMKWTWFHRPRPLNDLARYDEASRGPHGSLWLLITLRGRDVMSTLAAVVTILAVVLDPIAQELIQYYSCSRAQPASVHATPSLSASIQRTSLYAEAQDSDSISYISYGLKMAINAGLYGRGSTVGFQCSSGYCTFPDGFFTFGYAHHCEDVSHELSCTSSVRQQNVSTIETDPQTAEPIDSWAIINVTDSYLALPSGLKARYSYSSFEDYYQDEWVMNFNQDLAAVELLLFQYLGEPADCSIRTTGNWTSRGYGAARCTLKPAVLAVNASVSDSKLHEKLALATDTFGDVPKGAKCQATSTIYVPCLDAADIANLADAGHKIPAGAKWLPIYNSYICLPYYHWYPGKTTIIPQKCMFTYGYSLDTYFATFFNPGGVSWTESDNNIVTYNSSIISEAFYNSGQATFESVDGMFANMSASMTTYVREHGDEDFSAPAVGDVVTTLTCIRVRWGLISYPAALAVVTIAFFIALVIAEERSRGGKAGEGALDHEVKGSSLALLFYGLDERTSRKVEALSEGGGTTTLGKEVEKMPVSLRFTNRGWKFVSEEDKGAP